MEGPFGLLHYLGHGKFSLRKKPLEKTKIGLIAGGSGITPCFQIIQAASKAKDGTKIVLLYSNKTKSDILLHDELERFAKDNSENFKVFHTLTREKDISEWTGLTGRITEEMIKSCGLPEPSPDTLIAHCGPAPFTKTVEEILTKLGYSKDMIHKF